MVPFPDSADRLSPSGPFLPISRAGLVRGGSDCTREDVTYPPAAPFIFQRTNSKTDLIQIPLPNFRPGNSILTVATVSYLQVEQEQEGEPSAFVLFPLIVIGSNTFAVDNTFNENGGSFEGSDLTRTLTQVALWRPDPAQITQDPVIGWAGIVAGPNTPVQIPGGAVGTAGNSAWFVAFEIGEDSITQVCPTKFMPVPP
jgi:hypothetical protein